MNRHLSTLRSFSVLALVLLLFCVAAPVHAIRLVTVRHLFDLTAQLRQPSDVAVSAEGRIYVVDGVNNRVCMFDPQGRPAGSFGKAGSGRGAFASPLGIALDGAGRVYVADSGNHRIQIFSSRGRFLAAMDAPPSEKGKPADPTDVAVDDHRRRCYVVDNDNHRILVYDLATRRLKTTYGTPGTGKRNFRYPFLMALDREQYLYIVDVINTRVQVLNPEGLFVSFIGGWGVEKGEFFRPKGVAVDRDGRVFVSDSYMGVIQVFDSATSEFTAAVGDMGKGTVKKFRTPVGLFIDHRNRLYVVEMFADRVGVYQIEGESGRN